VGAPEELILAPGSLVIADLHLDVEEPGSTSPFLAFLERVAGAPRLIVLGDLFEYWIGPAQTESAHARAVLEALARLVASGTELDVVPGNRDFLLDELFEAGSRARVRRDGLLATTPAGERVLFLHGDELSTRDRSYQRLRRVLRSGAVRWLATHLPQVVLSAIARRLRDASRRAVSRKETATLAMQPDAALARARASSADLLVCGHGHRFREEHVDAEHRWLVLDAWGGERDTLTVGREGRLVLAGGGSRREPD